MSGTRHGPGLTELWAARDVVSHAGTVQASAGARRRSPARSRNYTAHRDGDAGGRRPRARSPRRPARRCGRGCVPALMTAETIRSGVRARPAVRALVPVGIVLAGMAAWEILKALWQIPDFKLPHSYAILGELIRRTGNGELWLVVLGRNALVTGGEALVGCLMGGLAGFLIAVGFIHWPLMEQGLLPY